MFFFVHNAFQNKQENHVSVLKTFEHLDFWASADLSRETE